MNVESALNVSSTAMLVSALLTFLGLSLFAAPYGKYSRTKGFGALVPAQLAWAVMESPNLWVSFAIWYYRSVFNGDAIAHPVNELALWCFLIHYINRSIIYPLRMSTSKATPMPLSVMIAAFVFCSWNGANQAFSLIVVGTNANSQATLLNIRSIVGVLVFLVGFIINITSDNILIQAKKMADDQEKASIVVTSKNKYVIPRGGFFEYVSCANYCKSFYLQLFI